MLHVINHYIATSAFNDIDEKDRAHYVVLDVRDLVDKEGNKSEQIENKIKQGIEIIGRHQKVVVCCDYGVSRSNSIAAGIIATFEGISIENALQKIFDAIGVKDIKIQMFRSVYNAIENESVISKNQTLFIAQSDAILNEFKKQCDANRSLIYTTNALHGLMSATLFDAFVRRNGVSTIVYIPDYYDMGTNNSFGEYLKVLKNILDVASINDIFFMYVSDSNLFNGYDDTIEVYETTAPKTKNSIGDLHLCSETLIKNYVSNYCICRSAMRFGGTDIIEPRFLSNFIFMIRDTSPSSIVLHRYNNGLPAVDLIHVSDFTFVIIQLVKTKMLGTVNVGVNSVLYIKDIVQMVLERYGVKSEIEYADIENTVSNVKFNSNKLNTMIVLKPKLISDYINHLSTQKE